MRTLSLLFILAITLPAQRPQGLRKDFFSRETLKVAVDAADKARVQRTPDGLLLAACGRVYLRAGEKDRAESAFARSLEEGTAEVHLRVGEAWMEAGIPDRAIPVLMKTPVNGRSDADSASKAAGLLLGQGKVAEAVALQERALRASPKNWHLCAAFAKSALLAGQKDLAHTWFEKTIALQPNGDEVWLAIANAHLEATK